MDSDELSSRSFSAIVKVVNAYFVKENFNASSVWFICVFGPLSYVDDAMLVTVLQVCWSDFWINYVLAHVKEVAKIDLWLELKLHHKPVLMEQS